MGRGSDTRTIERVLILANFGKPAVRQLAGELEPWLTERVGDVDLEDDIRAFCSARTKDGAQGRAAAARPDLVVVLGGDGALLGAVRAFADDPVPTLGINLGRVGFLASTPATRWQPTLEEVLAGGGVIEPRQRILAEWQADDGRRVRGVALNEVVVQRASHQGMLTAALRVDEHWVTNYRADGVIVATASGSTAYSLSAGGPILEPAVEAFVVTPICPQGLSNRPLVVRTGTALSLSVTASDGITTLALDGQAFHPLRQGQVVGLELHPEPYPLIAMAGLDPYRRLRERLGWRGSVQPDVFRSDRLATAPEPPGQPDDGEHGLL